LSKKEQEQLYKLLEKAVPAVARTVEEIVVRDILPKTDLGYPNEVWQTATLASGATSVISLTPLEDKVLGFYGIKYLEDTGLTTLLKFFSGVGRVNPRVWWSIEEAITEKDREITVKAPEEIVLYEPGEYVDIEYWMATTGVSRIQLLGFVAERKEVVIGGGSRRR